MPKVMHIFNRLILGGVSAHVIYLVTLLEPNFESTLVIGSKESHEKNADFLASENNIVPIVISSLRREINLVDDIKSYWQLRKIIRKHKPDIVHTHTSKPGTLGRLAAFHENVPVILHTFHGHAFHSYFGKLKTNFFIQVERYLAKISTKIIAISKTQKEELSDTYKICDSSKIEIVPLGLDLNKFIDDSGSRRIEFRDKYGIETEEVAIGIIGRLVPIKNHEFLIEVIKLIQPKLNKKIRVIVVGDGHTKEALFSKLKQLNISYNYYPDSIKPELFTFTSWIDNMESVYPGLDIVCLTSINEGTPVSLIEAQASSKAIVTTNVGGVKDILLENISGFITEVGDSSTFSESLLKLIENEELRKQMGEKGREFVIDQFDKQRMAMSMTNLYTQLLKKVV